MCESVDTTRFGPTPPGLFLQTEWYRFAISVAGAGVLAVGWLRTSPDKAFDRQAHRFGAAG